MALKFSDLQNRIPGNYLNFQYDSVAGNEVAGGTGFPLYGSLLGVELELDNATAAILANPNGTGTLYAGLYRYVCFITTGTTAFTRGAPCFWSTTQTSGTNLFQTDGTQYTVSLDHSASVGDGFFAGVVLMTYATHPGTTVATGLFGWIQTTGIASCLFQGSITDTTIGDLVILTTNALTFNALSDATASPTAGGAVGLKNIVGITAEAAASSTVSRVVLWPKNLIF